MENNLQLDLATLALKGKRYQEAESVYMQIATQNNAPEAWVGLGVCKLYQLSEGRTMDEIIFCFNKAFQILPEEKRDIEIQLLSNATIVFLKLKTFQNIAHITITSSNLFLFYFLNNYNCRA